MRRMSSEFLGDADVPAAAVLVIGPDQRIFIAQPLQDAVHPVRIGIEDILRAQSEAGSGLQLVGQALLLLAPQALSLSGQDTGGRIGILIGR